MTLLLLLACTPDQGLVGKDGTPFDSGDLPVDDTAPPPPEEVCNGVDDDGDGEVDEGFPDADGNGRVDCLDATCPPLTVAVAGPVDIAADCEGASADTLVADPWHVRVKWTLPEAPLTRFSQSIQPPLVADLDGDGAPEIVVLAYYVLDGEVVVVDGATGAVRWSATGVFGLGGLGVADVDDDGAAEILVQIPGGRVQALGADGSTRWTSTDAPSARYYPTLTAADLDGDGAPEVVADDLVLDGATGATLARLGSLATTSGRETEIADLDGDGTVELYLAGQAYNPDGTPRWATSSSPAQLGHWAVALQADADPEGEIVFLGDSFGLYDTDGTLLFEEALDDGGTWTRAGVPCVADLDGDHEPEIAYVSASVLYVRDADGTLVWEADVEDPSGLAGCAATDLDGDGGYELLLADQFQLWVFDGATGATRVRWTDHVSDTGTENPVVADLDGDGAAEILTVQSGTAGTTELLVVLEHDGDGWYAAGESWPVRDFDSASIGARGEVAARAGDAWQDPALLRATTAAPWNEGIDLVPVITDLCVADCTYGPVALAFTVENRGATDVPAGVEAVVFAEDGGVRREVARVSLPALPGGATLAGITVDLAPADLGEYGIGVAVDPPDEHAWGEVLECDESDDADVWPTGC